MAQVLGHRAAHVAQHSVYALLCELEVPGIFAIGRRAACHVERLKRGVFLLRYEVYLLTQLLHLCRVLRVVGVERPFAYGEAQLHLALAVAHLRLGLRQEIGVGDGACRKSVVEPSQGVNGASRYDGGVAVENAVVVFYRHVHIA